MIIPYDNQNDLADIDPLVREGLLFIPCKEAGEVLRAALCPSEAVASETRMETVVTKPSVLPEHTAQNIPAQDTPAAPAIVG